MREKLYVPMRCVNGPLFEDLIAGFTHEVERYITPQFCDACYKENEGDVPCEEDRDDCPHRMKTLVMYDRIKLNGKRYLGLWRGDIPLLMDYFQGFTIRDLRSRPKMKSKLKFKGKLRPYQIKAVKRWKEQPFGGMITAPARSGKTVIGCYLTIDLGFKTLILAHQIDLLDQFYTTFEELTNLNKISTKKNPVVAIAKKGNILQLVEQGVDVILSTYQTFISTYGGERLRQVRDSFGLVEVDECHLVGANMFSQVVTQLNPAFRLGLTATPERKDGRDVLARYALGNIQANVTPPQLNGVAIMVSTSFDVGQFHSWAIMLNRLAYNKQRNKLIVSYAEHDLKAGHCLVLITERRRQCEELNKMFTEKGIKSVILYGNIKDRKELLNTIRAGKVPVTIATRKIAQYGLNVPPWSCYYCLSPTNNPPNFYQEMSRIRTPHPGKPQPLVRVFVDRFGAAYACAKTCASVLKQEKFKVIEKMVDADILKESRKRKKKKAKKTTNDAIFNWNKTVK